MNKDKAIYKGNIFKVGTKIIGQNFTNSLEELNGKKGIVLSVETEEMQGDKIAVQFEDEFYEGHSCDGLGNNGYCRYFGNNITNPVYWDRNENLDNLKVLIDNNQFEFDF